ncbi:MAG: GtrA family protein [Gammaproteobacteria bacterium]
MTLKLPPFLKKYIRYNLVGIVGTLIYLAILFSLVEFLHWDPVVSTVIAFIVNVIFNYILNYLWVFESTRKVSDTLLRFSAVSLIGLIMNTGIMYSVVHILVWPYYWGVIFSTIVTPLTNFLLHHFWTFRR